MYDVTILTCEAYYKPHELNSYISNILLEEQLIKESLESNGLKVDVTYWSNKSYDWTSTKSAVFRTVWDYFVNFEKFYSWLNKIKDQTKLINSYELVNWNINKKYLLDLESNGINIVPTRLIKKGSTETLKSICSIENYGDIVIKPAISAAAYQTYKITSNEVNNYEDLFSDLTQEKDMLVQPFFEQITSLGEASLMIFDGNFSHAILKRAREGDFRVQDDFGGTVECYIPTEKEISFALDVISACKTKPSYGRVDIVWDKSKEVYLSELELFEPELWFRENSKSAGMLAEAVKKVL